MSLLVKKDKFQMSVACYYNEMEIRFVPINLLEKKNPIKHANTLAGKRLKVAIICI